MGVNLKQLLSNYKFIPIYLARKNLKKYQMGPVAVELHWTSKCNYNCVHCSYGSRRKSKIALSETVIQQVIDDLISLKTNSVYLSGGGEPTTVREWKKYAVQLINHGIEVALITNGVFIMDSDLDILRKLNYIAVSIYSSDEGEYKRITEGVFFQKQFSLPSIIKNGNSYIIVGARCVLNKINYKNVVSIYQNAIDSGYDYVIFIPAVDYENRGINLSSDEMEVLKGIIQRHFSVFDFSKTNLDMLLRQNVSYYEDVDYLRNFTISQLQCKAIEVRGNAFINYDGGVYLCQPHIGEERYCIGNVNEMRFKEIWNSDRHSEVINLLNKQFSVGFCRRCRSIGFNKAVYEYEMNEPNTVEISNDTFI